MRLLRAGRNTERPRPLSAPLMREVFFGFRQCRAQRLNRSLVYPESNSTCFRRLYHYSDAISGGCRLAACHCHGDQGFGLSFIHSPCPPTIVGLRGFTNSPICKTLADDSRHKPIGALCIFAAESRAVRIAEIELSDVAVKVLLAAMLVDALHPALED